MLELLLVWRFLKHKGTKVLVLLLVWRFLKHKGTKIAKVFFAFGLAF